MDSALVEIANDIKREIGFSFPQLNPPYKREYAYITSTHPSCFRFGHKAKITGVFVIQPNPHLDPRPCFRVMYEDGLIDYIAISDLKTYIILKESDPCLNKLNKITYGNNIK